MRSTPPWSSIHAGEMRGIMEDWCNTPEADWGEQEEEWAPGGERYNQLRDRFLHGFTMEDFIASSQETAHSTHPLTTHPVFLKTMC